jgi:diguanylate cyclase (GGDEF)-like protein
MIDTRPPLSAGRARELAQLLGLAAIYSVAGKLGLRLAFVHASATAVWPPTGIAIAAFLILGTRFWPAIFLGAFLVNVTTAGSVATSIGIAAGNTLEGVLGAYLVNRFAGGRHALERAPGVFKFALLAALLSTTVSATLGLTSLVLGGYARPADYGAIWLTWWLGDVAGDLVVAPVVLLWFARPRIRWRPRRAAEALALFVGLLVMGQIVFGGWLPTRSKDYPLEFATIPLFLWAAFRFGSREAATAILITSGMAIWGTLRGFGPFVEPTQNESLLLLQAFIGVASVMTLTLAAVVAERRRVEVQLRHLAVSDPLTGLANYRQLVTALEAEIQRSQRTERSFAVVLLDVDSLKKINDRHGHLVGSQALCRVAEVLHVSCRAIDTAARFGGDEFALVLPEADEATATLVMARVAQRLAEDRESPRVSVSLGAAIHPRDGASVQAMLDAADRELYGMKARKKKART